MLLKVEGGVLSDQQLAQHLGNTSQGLGKNRDRNQVYWLEIDDGYVYPAFQLGLSVLLPGIRAVLEDEDPWTRVNFMLAGNAPLGGRRPIDVLRGDVALVTRAARGLGEHSA